MFGPENIIIRPPVEAHSILIPVTGGCSWNRCRFCGVYKGIQNFEIRPLEAVLKDIMAYAQAYPDHPWVYMAGGNPTVAPTEYLVQIISAIRKNFRKVERISSYSKVLDIIQKTESDLKNLAEAGLTIVYMGMESGDDEVLRIMKKGTTSRSLIIACKKLLNAGIEVSLYIILGLGGKKFTLQHADNTAKTLNAINPTYFRFRTLNILDNSPLKNDVDAGKFEILTPLEILQEQRKIISQLDLSLTSKFRNDHISNYTRIHSDNIGQDREKIVAHLDDLIVSPDVAKWKHKGLKQM